MPVNESMVAVGLAVVVLGGAAFFTSGHGSGRDETYYGPAPPGANGGAGAAYDAALGRALDAGQIDCVGMQRCTQVEFDTWAYGRTKAQIRGALGSPLLVKADDSWYYSSPPIFDRDAGTQVPVTIKFLGLPSPDDTVAGTQF